MRRLRWKLVITLVADSSLVSKDNPRQQIVAETCVSARVYKFNFGSLWFCKINVK